MLILTRKVGQIITIGDNIEVQVVEIGRGWVKLGITAPSEMPVLREEAVERGPRKPRRHSIGGTRPHD